MYYQNLKQTDMVRLTKIQYSAAKIVTGALHHSSDEKLNVYPGWETLKEMAEYLGITLFHKIHLHETRPLIRKYLPEIKEHAHNLRSS